MSINVPPAPLQEAAPSVFAQLAEFASETMAQKQVSESGHKVPAAMILSSALAAIGVMLHVCAFAIACASQSEVAHLALLMGNV